MRASVGHKNVSYEVMHTIGEKNSEWKKTGIQCKIKTIVCTVRNTCESSFASAILARAGAF